MFGELSGARRTNPSLISGFAALSSSFSINTGALGTFQATGLSFKVPGAGTYLITGQVRSVLTATFNTATVAYLQTEIVQSDTGAAVPNSITLVNLISTSTQQQQLTCGFVTMATITAACTVSLYATANANGSITAWSNASIETLVGSVGGTTMAYLKVS